MRYDLMWGTNKLWPYTIYHWFQTLLYAILTDAKLNLKSHTYTNLLTLITMWISLIHTLSQHSHSLWASSLRIIVYALFTLFVEWGGWGLVFQVFFFHITHNHTSYMFFYLFFFILFPCVPWHWSLKYRRIYTSWFGVYTYCMSMYANQISII